MEKINLSPDQNQSDSVDNMNDALEQERWEKIYARADDEELKGYLSDCESIIEKVMEHLKKMEKDLRYKKIQRKVIESLLENRKE